jgi:hypothetical protein
MLEDRYSSTYDTPTLDASSQDKTLLFAETRPSVPLTIFGFRMAVDNSCADKEDARLDPTRWAYVMWVAGGTRCRHAHRRPLSSQQYNNQHHQLSSSGSKLFAVE